MKKQVIVALSLLVIVGSLVSIWYRYSPRHDAVNEKLFQALGTVAGEETVKLLGGKGTAVLVVIEGATSNVLLQTQTESFRDALRAGGVKLLATESVKLGTPETEEPLQMRWEEFTQLLSKYPGLDVLVSFVGAPQHNLEEIRQLPTPRPKLVVLNGDPSAGLKELLAEDFVQVAIISRWQPPAAGAAKPRTLREHFARYFTVVTRDNAAEKLPY